MSNLTNDTEAFFIYESLETALNAYVSLIGEYFWVFVYFPTAVVGFFCNLLSFIIFLQKDFNIKLYSYFRLVSFVSIVNCLIASVYPFSVVKRMGFISNFAFLAWQCYFSIPIGSLDYYYCSVLDILILLDRLSTFIQKLRDIYAKVNTRFLCIFSLVICIVINFPNNFVFEPGSIELYYYGQNNNTIEMFRMTYALTSQFALSSFGQILTYLVYALRDVVTTLAVIILNIFNLIYLKNHLKKKNKIIKRASIFKTHVDQTDQSNTGNRKESNAGLNGNVKKSKTKQDNVDRKASIMVLVMCSMTTISNALVISSTIYFYFNMNAAANLFGQFAEYVCLFKFSSQIFVFYSFNSIFKAKLRTILRIDRKK